MLLLVLLPKPRMSSPAEGDAAADDEGAEKGFCTTGPPLSLRTCPALFGGLLEAIGLSAAVLAKMLLGGGGARTRPAAAAVPVAPPPPFAALSIRSCLLASSSSVDRLPTDILALISSFSKIWFSSRATVSADSSRAFSADSSSNSADKEVYREEQYMDIKTVLLNVLSLPIHSR